MPWPRNLKQPQGSMSTSTFQEILAAVFSTMQAPTTTTADTTATKQDRAPLPHAQAQVQATAKEGARAAAATRHLVPGGNLGQVMAKAVELGGESIDQ